MGTFVKRHVPRSENSLQRESPKQGVKSPAVIFLILWFFFSGCTLFLNKYILSTLKAEPTFLGLCQLLSTAVCGFIQMNITSLICSKQKSKATWSVSFILNMLVVGILRFGTVVFSLVSLKYVAVSFTETVKSSAPLFTVIISRLLLGEKTGLLVNLSLIPVMSGLALCSANELSFDSRGFLAALATNLVECCQNVYSKLLISGDKYQYTPTELQFYASLAAVTVQLPVNYFLQLTDISHLAVTSELAGYLAVNGLAFHLQSFTAYVLMGYINPVTYSVANTVKRAVLISTSVILFNNHVTALSAVGTAIVLFGVFCYNQARQWHAPRSRIAHIAPRPLPPSSPPLSALRQATVVR